MSKTGDVQAPLPAAVRITDPQYRGSPRHAIAEEKFVLKQPRMDGERELVEEVVNELVAYRLGLRLGLPVPETTAKPMENGEIRIASAFYSAIDLQHTSPEARLRIANIEDLPGLLVFDQFIFNTDRREDHIMLTSDPMTTNNARWYPIDHGHALFGPSSASVTMETIMLRVMELAPVGVDYRVIAFSALEPWIERVGRFTDHEVDILVDGVVQMLRDMGIPVATRARVEFHGEILRTYLKMRRDQLPKVLQRWWSARGVSH